MNNFPIWRKLAIALCIILILACAVYIGYLSEGVRQSYDKESGIYNRTTALFVKNLYYFVLLLSAFLFSLSSRVIGNANNKARKLCYATHTFFVLSMIAMFIGIKMYPKVELIPYPDERLLMCLSIFLPTACIYSIFISFLTQKSNEEYSVYYLIPSWMINTYQLRTNLGKRLFMVFIIYPLFYLVLIPVIGLWVLICYIFPILLILWVLIGIYNIISWIIEGREMDKRYNL